MFLREGASRVWVVLDMRHLLAETLNADKIHLAAVECSDTNHRLECLNRGRQWADREGFLPLRARATTAGDCFRVSRGYRLAEFDALFGDEESDLR